MDKKIKDLATSAGLYKDLGGNLWPTNLSAEKAEIAYKTFSKLMVEHAIECVRDVLRDEDSELTYKAATQVQDRLREYFGVSNN